MSQQQPPSTAPPVSRSQGQEADLLRRSRAASELSFLAASTSLFLDAVAKRGNGQGMQRLAANGQHFAPRVPRTCSRTRISGMLIFHLDNWCHCEFGSKRATTAPNYEHSSVPLPALLDRALHGQADPVELTSAALRLGTRLRNACGEQSILMVSPLG